MPPPPLPLRLRPPAPALAPMRAARRPGRVAVVCAAAAGACPLERLSRRLAARAAQDLRRMRAQGRRAERGVSHLCSDWARRWARDDSYEDDDSYEGDDSYEDDDSEKDSYDDSYVGDGAEADGDGGEGGRAGGDQQKAS
jgi:hypothetical protein